jgi:hypothetical protein
MGHLNEGDLKTALRQETIKGLEFNPQSASARPIIGSSVFLYGKARSFVP